MSPLAKSSLKSAAHIGCRIALWLFVVIPALVVAARADEEEEDDPYLLIPRMLFMIAVALITIRYLGRYFKAGNIVYVWFETAVAILICYVALTVIWANVEAIGYLLLAVYSYLLEVIWGKGLDEDNVESMEFIMTTALASAFLIWVLFSAVDLNGPEYSVRFSSVVEVRFIVPQSHRPHCPTTEQIKAPGDPGRNPVVKPSATPSHTVSTDSWDSGYSTTTVSGCSSSTSQSTDGLLESVHEFLNDRTK